MSARYVRDDCRPVVAPVATATAVAVCDLVGLSSGNVVTAAATTWDTDLATTQAAFVLLFLGASGQRKTADVARVPANGQDNRIRVDTDGIFEFDTASASYTVGQLVGPAKQSGNALENQKVAAAGSESVAIGRVVEATTSATKVMVKLLSKLNPSARQS